ncbi:hypothetical protein CDL15_Pgr012001 [Punica granatum]|uniref:Uncharacterized protein n=1 Tax=Punica granatum TaxID=22663 RepID=A0A218WCJ1_PUNGR|nr:hypothetical protein CDL15_Pgr012001 [Punica granatum]
MVFPKENPLSSFLKEQCENGQMLVNGEASDSITEEEESEASPEESEDSWEIEDSYPPVKIMGMGDGVSSDDARSEMADPPPPVAAAAPSRGNLVFTRDDIPYSRWPDKLQEFSPYLTTRALTSESNHELMSDFNGSDHFKSGKPSLLGKLEGYNQYHKWIGILFSYSNKCEVWKTLVTDIRDDEHEYREFQRIICEKKGVVPQVMCDYPVDYQRTRPILEQALKDYNKECPIPLLDSQNPYSPDPEALMQLDTFMQMDLNSPGVDQD